MPLLRKHTGLLVLTTLVLYLFSLIFNSVFVISVISAWLANLAMWNSLNRGAKRQSSWLFLIGISCLLFAASRDVLLGWQQIFAVNLPMLAMFVAVSFLDLTNNKDSDASLPMGTKAIFNTALGVQVLGAVINLSVIMVFADRMKGKGLLSPTQQYILTRNFSAAAWWSPFFVATGVAITYSPGMNWQETLIPGLVMGLVAVIYSSVEASQRNKTSFRGYPIRKESLVIPLFLACAVILAHYLSPDISILVLICMLAPSSAVLLMRSRPRHTALVSFVQNKLPQVGSQFALFLAAGVFSSGIAAVIQSFPDALHLQSLEFNAWLFAGILAAMILAGMIGIHPVVSIAISSPLLLPLNPAPSQLGFLFLSAWAISAGSSGLTGLGLLMTSRYGIATKTIVKNSYQYAICMWLLCCLINLYYF